MPVPYTYYVHVDADHPGTLRIVPSIAYPNSGNFALVFSQGKDRQGDGVHLRLDNLEPHEVLTFAIQLWDDAIEMLPGMMAHKRKPLTPQLREQLENLFKQTTKAKPAQKRQGTKSRLSKK